MSDRIKLAEAMGWKPVTGRHEFERGKPPRWAPPYCAIQDGPLRKKDTAVVSNLPDPFTDANDDYAVLEWAIKNLDPDAYFAALTEVVGSYAYLHEYRIGYFARAALKVIATEQGESDE